MPLPAPRAGEARNDFIGRCMGAKETQALTGDTPAKTQDIRLAACFRTWRDTKKGGGVDETKRLILQIKDLDKGHVEAVVATFGVVDHDGDVTLPGAIAEGAKVTISDFGHSSALPFLATKPAGKGTIHVTEEKGILVGQYFLGTAHGREAFETVKAMGAEQEWSFGYDVLKHQVPGDEWKAKGARRMLEKLAVKEVSPVLVGAGIGTGTLATKERDDAQRIRLASEQEVIRFERTRTSLLRAGVQLKAGPMKAVDGTELTAGDFAYVPDATDPAGWKLPIHDEAHVRAALARWNQTDMTDSGARMAARRKLLAAAHRHNIDTAGFEKANPK